TPPLPAIEDRIPKPNLDFRLTLEREIYGSGAPPSEIESSEDN
ncbi:hypothetical protein KIPB_010861, partial [Kipferlia bialata]